MKPADVTIIHCRPSVKRVNERYQKFDERIKKRRRPVEPIYSQVEKFIYETIHTDKKEAVYKFLDIVSKKIHVKCEYVLKRRREGMIIWFCENIDRIMKEFPDIQHEFNIIHNMPEVGFNIVCQDEIDLQPLYVNEESLALDTDVQFDF